MKINKLKIRPILIILYFVGLQIFILYNVSFLYNVIVIVLGCLLYIKAYKFKFKKIIIDVQIALFFEAYMVLLSLISLFFHTYDIVYQISGLKSLVANMLIVTIITIMICNGIKANQIITYMRNLGIIILLLGIIELISENSFFENLIRGDWRYVSENYRVRIFFQHPIVYGCFLTLLLFLMIEKPLKNMLGQILVNLLWLINCLSTLARSTWLSCLLVISIYFFFNYNRKYLIKKKLLNYFILFFLVCIIVGFIGQEQLSNILENVYQRIELMFFSKNDASKLVRFANISNILQYCKTSNFILVLLGNGAGFGTYFIEQNPVYGWSGAIDNQYFTTLLEFGIIGFIGMAMLLVLSIKDIVKKTRKDIRIISSIEAALLIESFFFEGFSWKAFVFMLTLIIILKNKIVNEEICVMSKYSDRSNI